MNPLAFCVEVLLLTFIIGLAFTVILKGVFPKAPERYVKFWLHTIRWTVTRICRFFTRHIGIAFRYLWQNYPLQTMLGLTTFVVTILVIIAQHH
jgi:hypothetical protein